MFGNVNYKYGYVTPPGAIIDNAALTTTVIDTLGFERLEVVVILGATDVAMTALKLQEADAKSSATALTSGADISGADYSGAYPSATDDNGIFIFDVNLQGRKRYIDVSATGGDGTAGAYITILYRLSKAKNAADIDTLAGVVDRITV